MKNISNYKKRFFNLLESKTGDVKPILDDNFIKDALKEAAYGTCVINGDTLCKIKCKIKVAAIKCPKSREVKEIQHALAKKGYFSGEGGGMSKKCSEDIEACDGIFDWRTKKAVTEFQTEFGLSPDGVVGYETLTKMEEKGLIDPLNCNCEEEKKRDENKVRDNDQKIIEKETEEIEGIGKVDCNTIIFCVNYFAKRLKPGTIPNQDGIGGLLECLRNPDYFDKDKKRVDDDTQKCPTYIDCMPKIYKNIMPDERCTSASFKKRCVDTGKTKIAY